MTSDIRWVISIPDPVEGMAMVRDATGQVIEILARDRAAAVRIAKDRHALAPAAAVVSRLEFEEQRRELMHLRRKVRR